MNVIILLRRVLSQFRLKTNFLRCRPTSKEHTFYLLLSKIRVRSRFYFAGSSEMFGKVEEMPQSETTRFHPRSVYGITKVAGFELTRNYREAYGLFTCTGLLFNHESPRRGFEFVTRKISSTAARIKLGMETKLRFGNIDAQRDWGFSGENVKMMHTMLQQENLDEFVIGTGKTYTVRDFLQIVFEELNLNFKTTFSLIHVFFDQQK
jgi:GDPmannose 4,6-dehydratase